MKLFQEIAAFKALSSSAPYLIWGEEDILESKNWTDVETLGETMAEIISNCISDDFNANQNFEIQAELMPSYRSTAMFLHRLTAFGLLRSKKYKGTIWSNTDQKVWWMENHDSSVEKIRTVYTFTDSGSKDVFAHKSQSVDLQGLIDQELKLKGLIQHA